MGATPLAAFLSLALPPDMLRTPPAANDGSKVSSPASAPSPRSTTPPSPAATPPSPPPTSSSPTSSSSAPPPPAAPCAASGAHPGDALYVTGSLGGAHAELSTLLASNRPSRATASSSHPHLYPQPRLEVGAHSSPPPARHRRHRHQRRPLHRPHPPLRILPPPRRDRRHRHPPPSAHAKTCRPTKPSTPRCTEAKTTNFSSPHHPTPASRAASPECPSPASAPSMLTDANKPRITLIHPTKAPTELKPAGWQHFSQ